MNKVISAIVTTIIYVVGGILCFAAGWIFRAIKARKTQVSASPTNKVAHKIEKIIVKVANSDKLGKIEDRVFEESVK